jgi:hypothetical protein
LSFDLKAQSWNIEAMGTRHWVFESQWNKIWRWPHDVEISPYDPDKNIRIVDANNHLSASSRMMVSSVY